MKGTLTCTPKQLIKWLDEHLDDCPADWKKDDFDGRDGTVIVFNTEEEESEEDDDEEYEDDEPSDQEMMAAFGTKWHDGL